MNKIKDTLIRQRQEENFINIKFICRSNPWSLSLQKLACLPYGPVPPSQCSVKLRLTSHSLLGVDLSDRLRMQKVGYALSQSKESQHWQKAANPRVSSSPMLSPFPSDEIPQRAKQTQDLTSRNLCSSNGTWSVNRYSRKQITRRKRTST